MVTCCLGEVFLQYTLSLVSSAAMGPVKSLRSCGDQSIDGKQGIISWCESTIDR